MEPMDPGMDNPPHLGADGPDLPFGGPGFPDAFDEPEAPVVVEADPLDDPGEPAPEPDVDLDVVALPDLGEPVPVEPGQESTQFAHVPGAEAFLTMTPEARTDELVSIAEGMGAAESVVAAIRDAAAEQHGMIFEALTTYDPMARSTFMSMVLEVPADDAMFGGDEVDLQVDDADDPGPPMPPIVIDEHQTDPPEGQHGPDEEPEKPLVGGGDGLGQSPLPGGPGQPAATTGETPGATPEVAAPGSGAPPVVAPAADAPAAATPAAGGPPASVPAEAAPPGGAPAAGGPPAAPTDGAAPEVAAASLTPPASDEIPAGPPALDVAGPDAAPVGGDAADPAETAPMPPGGELRPPSADFGAMPAAAGGGEGGASMNSQAAATVGRVLEAAAGAAGGAIAGAVAGVRAVTRNKADRDQADAEKAPAKADEADPAAGADEAG